jgi:hypothetical protein
MGLQYFEQQKERENVVYFVTTYTLRKYRLNGICTWTYIYKYIKCIKV